MILATVVAPVAVDKTLLLPALARIVCVNSPPPTDVMKVVVICE